MTKQETSQSRNTGYDPRGIRSQFAILSRNIAWLDNAATTQRPESVLVAMSEYSRHHNANTRRSVHQLGAEATAAFEDARARVAQFVGSGSPQEIIFTSGTTAGINLVASGLARLEIGPGDHVWVTAMDHHSNWVPWQQVAQTMGASLKVIPLTPEGRLDLTAFKKGLRQRRTRWVAIPWVSNVLGLENNVREICDAAHQAGARVLVDGAQGVAHQPVDVDALGCDFFAFSGHKMFGPMGSGALWGRQELLEQMHPVVFGGEMIARVSEDTSSWAEVPYRFEAGTPNVTGSIGLAAAIRWLENLPHGSHAHVADLTRDAVRGLSLMRGVQVWGPPEGRASLVSFSVEGVHAHDVAQVLDERGVAVRAGHMCAQPLMRQLGIDSAVRASFAPYNTQEEVSHLLDGVLAAQELFT